MGMPNKIELKYGKSIDKTKILCYTIYVKVKKDYYFKYWGIAKQVRHETLTLRCVGSNPAAPAIWRVVITGSRAVLKTVGCKSL